MTAGRPKYGTRAVEGLPVAVLPVMTCACAAARQVARVVTQLYEEELRGYLEPPQFALLTGIDKRPGCNQASIARMFDIDKTTLSRNLALMKKKGWIGQATANDQREHGLHLTPAGRKLLAAARPGWKRAQSSLRSAMTAEQWEAMWQVFRNVMDASHRARSTGTRSLNARSAETRSLNGRSAKAGQVVKGSALG